MSSLTHTSSTSNRIWIAFSRPMPETWGNEVWICTKLQHKWRQKDNQRSRQIRFLRKSETQNLTSNLNSMMPAMMKTAPLKRSYATCSCNSRHSNVESHLWVFNIRFAKRSEKWTRIATQRLLRFDCSENQWHNCMSWVSTSKQCPSSKSWTNTKRLSPNCRLYFAGLVWACSMSCSSTRNCK